MHEDSSGRRSFTKRIITLGGLTLLSGCGLSGKEPVEAALRKVSRFNDRVQGWLFDPQKLAPTYPESMVTRPFPFNAYYDVDEVPAIDAATYRLQVRGLATGKRVWTLDDLRALPRFTQCTRLICIEGWSAIGRWTGTPLATFLEAVGADTTAKYVAFDCADGYSTSIDMASALHPQTMLRVSYADDALLPKYGFPLRLVVPTKVGFKSAKHIVAIDVTHTYPGGYWENQGYNWFSGS